MLIKCDKRRGFLAVQWLRLCPSSAGGAGSIPGQGTMIPHAAQQKKKKKKRVIKRTKDGSDQQPYRRKEGAMIIPGEKRSRQKEQGVVCAHIRVRGEGLKRNPWK